MGTMELGRSLRLVPRALHELAQPADSPIDMSRLVIVFWASVWAAACASSGAVPRPFPVPGGHSPSPPSAPADSASVPPPAVSPGPPSAASPSAPGAAAVDGYSVSSTALSLRGAPYRNGGTNPAGFDCSGFVKYVYEQHGIAMPREVRKQFALGHDVDPAALEPGDLVFFTTVAPGASHVGIAIGGDQFVHAPSTTGVVRVEHLSADYWSNRFVGAKRVN